MIRHAPAAGFAALLLAFAGLALAQPADDATPANRRVQAQTERLMANDKNNDGKLQADELPERLAERLFAAADADADGSITREELVAHLSASRPGGERRDGRVAAQRNAGDDARGFDGAMRRAGGAMRALRGSDFSPGAAESDLAAVQTVQESLLTAKASLADAPVSPQAEERFGDDRDAYHRAFREAIIGSLRAALDLEEAVLAGDPERAAGARQALLDSQKAAHDLFQEE